MKLIRTLTQTYQSWKRKKTIEFLCGGSRDPEEFIRRSEQSAVAAFHRVARRVPAYAKLLSSLGVEPSLVTGIESFKKFVPYLDKQNTFHTNSIQDLCLDGDLNGLKSILTSSGHSGIFSFGVNTVRNLKDSSGSIDLGLEYMFNISEKRSLLVNCLPMGVKVNTSLVIAETSVREDMVWAVIKKFSSYFDQTILIGEGSFLKKIIEEGSEQGIDWKAGLFHFVTGEEGIAENYRSYIAGLLGTDPEKPSGGIITSSMGVAELDLNIFHETPHTTLIRRLAHTNPALRHALFGEDVTVCPMLFVCHSHRTYIEELPLEGGRNELVISMLSPHLKIPLVRYKTGDIGRILSYQKVAKILKDFKVEKLTPDLKFPLVAVVGRHRFLSVGGRRISPEGVKEALYTDPWVASSITGAFKLTPAGNMITLEVQLRKGKVLSDDQENRFKAALSVFTFVPIRTVFYSYADFPYFMELDYERKFNYL